MSLRIRSLGRRAAGQDGFTLPELLTSMAVFGLLIGAFATLVSATITRSTEITDESVLQTQARAAVDELVADFRQAYTGASTAPVESFSSTTITFDSPDRATPFHLRQISYQLSGGKLQRRQATSTNTDGPPWTYGSTSAWQTQVDSVVNSALLQGYDSTGAATTTASAIRSIAVTITVATTASRGKQYTYSASASLRADAQ